MICNNPGSDFLFWNVHERKSLILPTTLDHCVARSVAAVIGERHPLLETGETDGGSSSSGTRWSVQHCCFSAVWSNNIYRIVRHRSYGKSSGTTLEQWTRNLHLIHWRCTVVITGPKRESGFLLSPSPPFWRSVMEHIRTPKVTNNTSNPNDIDSMRHLDVRFVVCVYHTTAASCLADKHVTSWRTTHIYSFIWGI